MTETGPTIAALARLFLKLGFTAFGGPAAHIALMEEEMVTRRKWVDRDYFLDLMGATNLIPGPNSTEMAIHLGYSLAGWRGLLVAGSCFILPAVSITGMLAWVYVHYGTLPQADPVLAAIQPAVVAIIAAAVVRLAGPALKQSYLVVLAVTIAALNFLGLNEVLLILGGGVAGMLWRGLASGHLLSFWPVALLLQAEEAAGHEVQPTLLKLGLFFLKIGSVLFGSGYVLVAFVEGDLVSNYGWLTQEQLIDAIGIGQFTPGPVLSTATFVGYLVLGWPGAIVSTAGIFAPSFLFVLILSRFLPYLRKSPWTSDFLDAVTASALALMTTVTVRLLLTSLENWTGLLIMIGAFVAVFGFRINGAVVIICAAALGWLLGGAGV